MTWPFDPTVYAGLLLLCAGWAGLARGAGDVTLHRAIYFGGGVLVAWLALETPLDRVADDSLQSAHMFQHVLLGIIAPPLWLLGLSPVMARRLARVPGLKTLAGPVPAQLIFAVVMVAWHVPVLYDLALAHENVHVFEHLTLMAGGTLYFWPVVGATAATLDRRLGEVGRIVYLLIGTLPQDTIGLILLFARQPFYVHYTQVARLVADLDPLTDQVLAGIVLEAAGKVSYLVAILSIFFAMLARARRDEAAA